jgi:hypothetical protein
LSRTVESVAAARRAGAAAAASATKVMTLLPAIDAVGSVRGSMDRREFLEGAAIAAGSLREMRRPDDRHQVRAITS